MQDPETKLSVPELKKRFMKMYGEEVENEIAYLRSIVEWYDCRDYNKQHNKTFNQLQRLFLESELGLNDEEY